MMPGCSSLAEVRASRWNRSTNSLSKASENGRDRKSTRLNSSHDQISYAVFCLKKKNKVRHADAPDLPPTRTRARAGVRAAERVADQRPRARERQAPRQPTEHVGPVRMHARAR